MVFVPFYDTGKYKFEVVGNIPHILSIGGEGTPDTYKHENPPAPPRVYDLKENYLVDINLHFWTDEGNVKVSMDLLELRAPSSTAFLSYKILGTNYCLKMNWLGECNALALYEH